MPVELTVYSDEHTSPVILAFPPLERSQPTEPTPFATWAHEYLSHFPGIDLSRIRSLEPEDAMGKGNEHYVFPIEGSDYVLKVPRKSERSFKTWETPKTLNEHYSLLQSYFGDTIQETYFLRSTTTTEDYCIVQKTVTHAKPLTLDMLEQDENLRAQFTQIIIANHNMYKNEKKYLPLLGREGAFATLNGHPELTNLVVEENDGYTSLKIVDFGLLTDDVFARVEERESAAGLLSQAPEHHSFFYWLMHPSSLHAQDFFEALRDHLNMEGNEVTIEVFFLSALEEALQRNSSRK